jgi:alanine racemase
MDGGKCRVGCVARGECGLLEAVKSWIEIAGDRLAENLRGVQAAAGAGVMVLAVVKANGYGHGATVVSPVLVAAGARWLGVSDVEEGTAVRAAVGDGVGILVMCGMESADAAALVELGLTPVVWTVEHIAAMEAAARAAGRQVAVHVEVDTGMARQGAMPGEELSRVCARLAGSEWVSCEGVMSHLSSSEVVGSAVTARQVERFALALEQVTAAGLRPGLVHLSNTSAVDEGSTMGWVRAAAERMGARAMVRTGIAVFGECLELEGGDGAYAGRLLPVMTWKTRVIGLREMAAGATVGYGATFVASGPMRLALLPVGYADGFRREASSGVGDGWVMIAGRTARVVGRVSMNLTTVDVTGMSGIEVGDEAVLLGEGVSAQDHAAWCGTIPYEILCGVKGRVMLV